MVTEPDHEIDGLHWLPFVREPLCVIAPAESVGDTDAELLEQNPFIWFNRKTWAGQQIERHLLDRGIRVHEGMEIDSLEAISSMVSCGLGVSIVPLRCCAEPFPAGLKLVPFGEPQTYRVVGLLERQGNPQQRLVQVLLRELQQLSDEYKPKYERWLN